MPLCHSSLAFRVKVVGKNRKKGVCLLYTSTQLQTPTRRGDNPRAVLLLVSFIAMIAVNTLANVLPLNGVTTGEISDRYATQITPAGYAFSIWSLIFAGMLALGIYQVRRNHRDREIFREIRGPLLWSSVFNIAWIFAWHFGNIWLSAAIIFVLLMSLVVAYVQLDRYPVASAGERWLVRAPVSIYMGWVMVATVVNIAVACVAAKVPLLNIVSPQDGAILALSAAAILGSVLSLRQGDIPFGATLIWAFVAIAVAQQAQPVVPMVALIAAGLVGISTLTGWLVHLRELRRPLPPRPAPLHVKRA
jgi:translocator protein